VVSKIELTIGYETKDRAVLWNVTQRSCVDARVAGMVHESQLTAAQKQNQFAGPESRIARSRADSAFVRSDES